MAVANTIKKNLPPIVELIQDRGSLALDAASELATTGNVVAHDVTSLSGKSVACATTAVKTDARSVASLNASVDGSAHISTACGGPGKK